MTNPNVIPRSLELDVNMIISSRFAEAAKKHNLLMDDLAFHHHVSSFSTTDEYFGSYASMTTEQYQKLCCGFVDMYPDGRCRISLNKETKDGPEFVAGEEIQLTKQEKKIVQKAMKKKLENCLMMLLRFTPSKTAD